jgi:hypothetical protein
MASEDYDLIGLLIDMDWLLGSPDKGLNINRVVKQYGVDRKTVVRCLERLNRAGFPCRCNEPINRGERGARYVWRYQVKGKFLFAANVAKAAELTSANNH